MSKEKFEDRSVAGTINVACKFDDGSVRYWTDEKQNIIDQVISIVTSYSRQGLVLTLRQLHYQFVSKDMKYVNHQTAYKKLGTILDDCRYAGLIDWNAIEDRGRIPHIKYYVHDLEDALQDAVRQYRLDRQKGQQNVVEVWTEKDALSGIFKKTTEKYHVKLVVNKGYTSSSAAYKSYKRFADSITDGKKVTILYFGDHDPSGLDMIRDINDRLLFFLANGNDLSEDEEFMAKVTAWFDYEPANWDDDDQVDMVRTWNDLFDAGLISEKTLNVLNDDLEYSNPKYVAARKERNTAIIKFYLIKNDLFKIVPIGLTKEQIDFYDLPPNPTKITDTRADGYIKQFGKTCWEVDALDAAVLVEIIEENIQKQIDIDLYNEVCEEETKQIDELKKFLNENSRDN